MKKFIISVLCVAVFFIGLGGLIQETGARFKSDERALALIKQAQSAIGGEAAISNIKSLTAKGSTSKTFDFDGAARTEQGEVELNLQFPNQFSKTLKLGRNTGNGEVKEVNKEIRVIAMERGDGAIPTLRQTVPNGENPRVFIRKKADGDKTVLNQLEGETVLIDETIDTSKVRKVLTKENVDVLRGAGFHQNELVRTSLALFLTAPQGVDVSYTYAGEGDVDGAACDIIAAQNGATTVKLFLDKSSHLPVMMSYQGHKPIVFSVRQGENPADKATRTFSRLEAPEKVEFQVRFSDYRSVSGVLLPHRWTQSVGGNADETIDISSYEINPVNISEKFQVSPTRFTYRIADKKAQ